MGGRGASLGGAGSTNAASNSFKSSFGFANVANPRISFGALNSVTVTGAKAPTIKDAQRYLDTGTFRNWGTNTTAKKEIIKRIHRDMEGRGFRVNISENKMMLTSPNGLALSLRADKKNGSWKFINSNSSGATSRGGMRGALDRSSRSGLK